MSDQIDASASGGGAGLFDPLAPGFSANPHPIFRRLREEDPVHRSEYGFWLVTRYDDVATVLRDPRFGRGRTPAQLQRYGTGPAFEYISRRLSGYNPPDHTRLRSLMTRAFTARRVESMRPHIQAIADRLLDDIGDSAVFDMIAQLAHPLPSLVICEMLGVPETDRSRFAPWTEAIRNILSPAFKPEWLAEADSAVGEFMEYIRALARKRRTAAADDLLSALIMAEESGNRLSENELVASVLFLFTAGHQTTRDLTGNGLLALLGHPDQMRRLVADPSLMHEAVEECLRFDSPVMMGPARCLEQATLGGRTIMPDDQIWYALSAANRDPARFPDPDRFDLARADKEHLAFGAGIHFCLGANLARAEAATIFSTMLRRYPRLELADETITWHQSPSFRGPVAVHVRVR